MGAPQMTEAEKLADFVRTSDESYHRSVAEEVLQLRTELAAAEARGIAVGRAQMREETAKVAGQAGKIYFEAWRKKADRFYDGAKHAAFALENDISALPHEPIKGDEGRDWRAMESAPMDGTPFVGGLIVHHQKFDGSHWEEWQQHVIWFDDEAGTIDLDCESGWGWEDFTHWIPLPPPPTLTRPAQIGPDGAGERREGA